MFGYQLTDVVKNLMLINVVMYVGSMLVGSGALGFRIDPGVLALHYPGSADFKPFQIITHMFMHDQAGIMHIAFNMFSLFMFGPPIEQRLGPKRFFFYYIACGFGAFLLHLAVLYVEINHLGTASPNAAMWGASGAIFGLLAAFGMLYPNQKVMLLIPPIPMKAKYFVLLFGVIELYGGVRGYGSNIAHFAHLGGAICGALFILYWKKTEGGI